MQEGARLRFAERLLRFRPDALGLQVVGFAGLDDLAHQRQRFVGDAEAAGGETRGEARDAQHAHRILGERRRDMAQDAIAQVGGAAKRVDQRAAFVLGDRVDRQVAPAQIVFERHVGGRVERETMVAAAGLAFGARERVLLAGPRVQEHREVLADRFVAQVEQVLRTAADDDIVAIAHRQTEQPIAHRTTDKKSFHAPILYK
jgi:hypothetical protein